MGRAAALLFAFLLFSLPVKAKAVEPIPDKPFIGYLEVYDDDYENYDVDGDTNSDRHRDPKNSLFAKVQPGVNMVNLAFLVPDYSTNKKGTLNGIPYSEKFLKRAVAAFHKQHPGVPVMISVGGGGPPITAAWAHFDPKAVAKLVRDTGLDGVEIDYERETIGCHHNMQGAEATVRCDTDEPLTQVIHSMRQALPRPAILSLATYGDAAYPVPPDKQAQDVAGMAINPLKRVGRDLDLVNIMGYGGDMGNKWDSKAAFLAFRKLFPGKLTMGVSVPQDRDRPFVSLQQQTDLASFINQQPNAGMMLWNLNNEGWTIGPNTAEHPSADMLVQAICEELHTETCPQKVESGPCPGQGQVAPPVSQSDWFQEAVRKIPGK